MFNPIGKIIGFFLILIGSIFSALFGAVALVFGTGFLLTTFLVCGGLILISKISILLALPVGLAALTLYFIASSKGK